MLYLKLLVKNFINNLVYFFFIFKIKSRPTFITHIQWVSLYSRYYIYVDINKLYIKLKDQNKLVKITDSPHFGFINSYHNLKSYNKIYKNYLIKHFHNEDFKLKEDDFIKLYHSLKKSLKAKSNEIEVFCYSNELFFKRKFILCDGAHRASILKALGEKKIKVNLVYKIK